MSCTSPLTVASMILPRAAVSAFSMNCSRWLTAAFIASADCSTSATISSLLLNSRPTSAMPAISGPLMMSSGAAPSARLQVEIGDQAVLGAFDDVVRQALIERQIRGVLLLTRLPVAAEMLGDGGDVELVDGGLLLARSAARQSSGAVRSDSSRHSAGGVLNSRSRPAGAPPRECDAKRSSFSRVDDRQVEPGLGAVVQEDRVDHFARRRRQAERDVRNPQHRLDVRDASP